MKFVVRKFFWPLQTSWLSCGAILIQIEVFMGSRSEQKWRRSRHFAAIFLRVHLKNLNTRDRQILHRFCMLCCVMDVSLPITINVKKLACFGRLKLWPKSKATIHTNSLCFFVSVQYSFICLLISISNCRCPKPDHDPSAWVHSRATCPSARLPQTTNSR